MVANEFPNSRHAFLMLALLGGTLPRIEAGQATDAQWTQTQTTRSGQIYHREAGNSSIPWIMIATTFDAPPARVHGIVMDYDNFEGLIPNVAESRILGSENDTQWVYHHLHFPGPAADRVYIIKSTDRASRPADNYYRVEWQLAERKFPDVDLSTGHVPDVLTGYWDLGPGEDARSTKASYAVFSDPGGFIPGWLVEDLTDQYVQQVVEAIRERLAGEQ